MYFATNNGLNGTELWKSDGTAAGTVMVKDINSGTGHSLPKNLINVNGTLYFTADDGTNGYELWKTDGTVAGTVKVINNINLTNLTLINNLLFFTTNDSAYGYELWALDLTANPLPVTS